jgi:hypothetical protein
MDRMCSVHLGYDVRTVKILVGKLKRKRPFGRPKIKWVNVKFDLKINKAWSVNVWIAAVEYYEYIQSPSDSI